MDGAFQPIRIDRSGIEMRNDALQFRFRFVEQIFVEDDRPMFDPVDPPGGMVRPSETSQSNVLVPIRSGESIRIGRSRLPGG